MSQHDFDVANAVNATLRSDLNNALKALASNSSGSSAPSSPTTHQLWLDTTATPYILKYYDGTDWIPLLRVNATTNKADSAWLVTPIGLLCGLTLSNNGSDASHDIDIAAGAAVDSTGAVLMALTAGMTKQLDAAWAAGSAAGGLFSGSMASSTWYHVHLIRKDSDGTIDVGFDTSVSAANKPAGYSYYRRIGSVYSGGATTIRAFKQSGRRFYWKDSTQEIASTAAVVGAWTDLTLTVPPDVAVSAFGLGQIGNGSSNKCPSYFNLRCPDLTESAPAADTGDALAGVVSASTERITFDWGPYLTSTAKKLQYYGTSGAADFALYLETRGYDDPAGA